MKLKRDSLKLTLRNIGLFKEANLLIDGITVIGGENDSGKSTIGKVLFSVIKADNIARFNFKVDRRSKISGLLNKIRGFLKIRYISDDTIQEKLIKIEEEILDFLQKKMYKNERNEARISLVKELDEIAKKYNDREILKLISSVKNLLDDDKAFLFSRKNEFMKQVSYNFKGKIQHFLHESEPSEIKLGDIYEITIMNNRCLQFNDKLPKDGRGRRIRPFIDVTLIESPLIMNLTSFFLSLTSIPDEYKRLIEYPNMLHDVVKKILFPKPNCVASAETEKLLLEIEELIEGTFKVENGKIYFFRNENKVDIVNVASGIKSFGLIFLLLKHGYIRDFSNLLIVDEPEVHLHPKWHLAYAKLLVEIYTTLGCFIIINTHSPYMAQAVRYFADEKGCIKDVHMYMAERKGDYSVLNLIDENTNILFDSLTSPIVDVLI